MSNNLNGRQEYIYGTQGMPWLLDQVNTDLDQFWNPVESQKDSSFNQTKDSITNQLHLSCDEGM